MKLFGSDRIAGVMQRLGMEENIPIEHGLITRAIENAQKKVEQYHFNIRKQVLEFDDVMNKQRESIYLLRRRILEVKDLKGEVFEMIDQMIKTLVEAFIPGTAENAISMVCSRLYPRSFPSTSRLSERSTRGPRS